MYFSHSLFSYYFCCVSVLSLKPSAEEKTIYIIGVSKFFRKELVLVDIETAGLVVEFLLNTSYISGHVYSEMIQPGKEDLPSPISDIVK